MNHEAKYYVSEPSVLQSTKGEIERENDFTCQPKSKLIIACFFFLTYIFIHKKRNVKRAGFCYASSSNSGWVNKIELLKSDHVPIEERKASEKTNHK